MWPARGLGALAVLLYGSVLVSRPLPSAWMTAVDDLCQLTAAAGAALCCGCAARRSAPGRARSAWVLLAAATGAWAGGQTIWTWFELVLGRGVPFPSPSDGGFLMFPVLAAAGLLAMPVGRGPGGTRARDLLDGVVAAGSLLILSWSSSLGGTVATGRTSAWATGLAVAYPLGDVVVLTLALLVLARPASGHRPVLVPLALGLAALAVADSTYLYLTASGSYASGDLCGIGWTAGFALIALAALPSAGLRGQPGRSLAAAPRARETGQGLPARLPMALPYLPLLPAQVLVTAQLLTGDRRAPAPEVALGLLLVLLVLARQFWTLADNRTLLLTLHAEREVARHAALHDPLTGLPNRTLFADRVAHALALRSEDRSLTTVLFCDLDDFKDVNDGLGHAVGDALLTAVGARLQVCLRPGDTVARLGGDEFAVLVEGDRSSRSEPPGEIAGRLVEALAAPVLLAGREVTVSVSIGVASACPVLDDGIDGAELLRRADLAMYAAKDSGKATWVSYDPQAHQAAALTPSRAGRPRLGGPSGPGGHS